MSMHFEASLVAQPQAISDLTERMLTFLPQAGVDTRASHHVAMAVEEILTNTGAHGGSGDRPATVRLDVEHDRVRVEIADAGAPFDPRETPDPDIEASLDDRAVGGLGLFLVRKLAQDIGYERRGETNITTFAVPRASL